MGHLDYHFEFYSEVDFVDEELVAEVDERLRALAEGHIDMIGASVGIEELTGEKTPHVFQARIVAYVKPDNVVGVEKAETLEEALRGAVRAVERQVRRRRDKMGRPWEQPRQPPDRLITE
jgi:ribosome-associated translation inhibitor RaiA